MILELSDAERELLEDILNVRLGELRDEVRHSRVSSFRKELLVKEELVRGIIQRLEPSPV